MRAFIFYPLMALISAGLIAASFGYALRPFEPAAQTGAPSPRGGVRFGPAELAHIDPGQSQLVYVDRAFTGAAQAVQIGTQRVAGPPDAARQGARLLLADGAAPSGAPLIVTVAYRPLANSVPKLSLSAQTGAGPTQWVSRDVPVAEGQLRFALPASAGPVTAIGLWPHPQTDEYYTNYGIEILSLRIERADQPPR